MLRLSGLLLLFGLVLLPSSALAQEASPDDEEADEPPPLVADRPGFGDASDVVAPGTIQVEGGVGFTDVGSAALITVGQLLGRYGVYPGVELRLLANSFGILTNGDTEAALQDLGVGAKVRLLRGDPEPLRRPSVTFIGSLTFDTGSDAVSGNPPATIPDLKLAVDWTMASNWAANVNAGYTFELGDGPFSQWVLYESVTYAISPTGDLSAFLGSYQLFPSSDYADLVDTSVGIDGGVTYLLDQDTQLDVNATIGLANDIDFGIGAGVVRRF